MKKLKNERPSDKVILINNGPIFVVESMYKCRGDVSFDPVERTIESFFNVKRIIK